MTRPDLEAIRRRLDAATPGPWGIINNQGEPPDGGWNVVATTPLGSASLTVARQSYRDDATLIAHAPADLAALVAHVERLEGLMTQAWDKLPEGYTVLRGQILQAQGYRGCTWCGFVCVDHEAEVVAVAADQAS